MYRNRSIINMHQMEDDKVVLGFAHSQRQSVSLSEAAVSLAGSQQNAE